MDFTEQSPTILSLCSGMRGLDRGLERAFNTIGWREPVTAAYLEIEAFVCWNLVKQMEKGLLAPAAVWTDIKTFDAKPFHGKISGIIGGYPCQPFSLAGKRKGGEDPRHLWPYIRTIVEQTKPVFCFFENVAGHLTMGYGEVYRSLRDMDYSVEAGIFTAQEVGAPHKRERLFILAILANTKSSKCQFAGGTRTGRQGFTDCYNELANTNSSRQREFKRSLANESELFTTKCDSKGNRFPAGPGREQHEWEPSRVESRMGYVFNGHNFREDLLRMAGNAVVEQTAELAFIELLKKHYGITIP